MKTFSYGAHKKFLLDIRIVYKHYKIFYANPFHERMRNFYILVLVLYSSVEDKLFQHKIYFSCLNGILRGEKYKTFHLVTLRLKGN